MRVLTVARWYPSHDSPGRGSFVADLVAATAAAGVDARVVSFDRVLIRGRVEWRDADLVPARAAFEQVATPEVLFSTPVSYGARGVPVARLPMVRRPGTGDIDALVDDHLAALRPFVQRLVRTWRPDVIHAHTGLPDGVAAAAVGRDLGIPVVVSEHASTVDAELVDPVARDHYRSLFEPGVSLLAVSPALAERVRSAVAAPTAEIGILPDPVADAAFPPADPTGRDPNELLWVGSLGEHKGIEVLVRALAHLRERRPAVQLRLIGDERAGGEIARWTALAAELGVGGAVAFEGWQDRAAVATAMARAAAFAHPSPSETFGVAAAEAILTGLPVAARSSGGVPWIIEQSGGYGRVAAGGDPDSPEAFAVAIEAVLAGDLAIGSADARARLVEAIGESAVARRAIQIYESVAGNTVAARRAAGLPPGHAAPLPKVVVMTGRDQGTRMVNGLDAGLRDHVVVVRPLRAPGDANEAAHFAFVEPTPVPRPNPKPRGRGPIARIRRALWRPAPTADELFAQAVLAAASGARSGRGPVAIVAIDAPAVMVVVRLGEKRARLAPGGLRWLADRWDAETASRR